ncbi:hypothetical protein GUJ93_ZPchr0005g15319 [Zizania palustris]|uniref:DUF569 domain-containing protein n=1 Tax=Zizania palustris TaxID=103762 RepID=A0A8J5S2X4_ZIZPA|nr:hypothetical protein GUJ93_ZPchr0005g15319 [Zizania palustris]
MIVGNGGVRGRALRPASVLRPPQTVPRRRRRRRRVCLSGQRGAHKPVWAVEHVVEGDVLDAGPGPFVRFRGAYGRYLVATDLQARAGPSHGVTAEQRDATYYRRRQAGRGRRSVGGSASSSATARGATSAPTEDNLRWRTAITVAGDNASSMMQWAVEIVPPRLGRPTLIDPPAQLIRRRRTPPTEREMTRVVRFVRADVDGEFDETAWSAMRVSTNSLMHLRLTLANRLGQNRDALHTTVCVRAGSYGCLSPLLVDLPIGNEPHRRHRPLARHTR